MKLNLPKASEIKRRQVIKRTIRESSVRKVAYTFLNGKLKDAINEAIINDGTSANVEVPSEAYGQNGKEFYTICIAELTKLGYEAKQSHDGGGMYSTLQVSWRA
jgi:hypothetical protein